MFVCLLSLRNHLYGREDNFDKKALRATRLLGDDNRTQYLECRRRYQERGDAAALETGQGLVMACPRLTVADRERLFGYLEGVGRTILAEPEPMLTPIPRLPGLDGQKMSKSYGNTISLREDSDSIAKKLRTMQTDPARVRRTDPGDPDKCPVWDFHRVYSDEATCQWVREGCRSAGIGCIECKNPVIESVLAELEPIRERAKMHEEDEDSVRTILNEGRERARDIARETMDEVREAMGLE